jgi:hypothetical protein
MFFLLFACKSTKTESIKIPSIWETMSIQIDKPYPTGLMYFSDDETDSCQVLPIRYIVNGKGVFVISTRITNDSIDFPKKRIAISTFEDSSVSKTIQADSCLNGGLCIFNFRMTYKQAEEFMFDVYQALQNNLSNEKAFLWAMKKRNWY